MMWGVRRGLFSNEAGQGSAPIAHAAAKTDEPVSEGVVALLEPFIDTIVICSMTGLVVLISGVWDDRHPTELALAGGDASYVAIDDAGTHHAVAAPETIAVEDGYPAKAAPGAPRLAWHEVAVERLFVDPAQTRPFTGTLHPREARARDAAGTVYASLYGDAVESGAPLTKLAFQKGLKRFGAWGGWIVLVSVFLFAI
jgi:AGCS family alanine or glycine:cation symporter